MTPSCPFCSDLPREAENELAFSFFDKNPVSNGHALVVPKRHVADYFELSVDEQSAIWALVNEMRGRLVATHAPDGFNVGINVGRPAGQTVMHVHVHLIPRYGGDIDDPRGGVRGVIPQKKLYPGAR